MKLGAEPKKVAALGGLIALAVVLQFMGGEDPPRSSNNGPRPAPVTQPVPSPASGRNEVVQNVSRNTRPNTGRRTSQEFKPVVRPRRLEDRIDPTTVDPTLRLELINRLSNIKIQGGNRPLFEFSAAPPPKAPDPGKIIPGPSKPVAIAPTTPAPVPVAVKPIEPSKPQAPPIPLRFYGFTSARAGAKRAFFLENEDVFVASEGQLVKNRYKVVRVNLNSVVMEDTQFQQQQTLPLVEQMQ